MIARRVAALAAWLALPRARLAVGMALAGVLAYFMLGTTPAALDGQGVEDAAWGLAPPTAPDLSAAQAAMAASPLWVSQPAAVAAMDAAPPPATPPRLIGIIRVGSAANRGAAEALFLMPDGRRERASTGARLADGTTVESLDDTRAKILMADGRTLELRLLDGPSAPANP